MRRWVSLMLLVALAAPACTDDGSSEAGHGKRQVLASFYPLAEAARRVGGERIAVTNLTPAGSEPHDLELAPSDVDEIEDADVVLYIGGGFQPAVEKAVERAQGTSVDVLDTGGGSADPHVWLDPTLMKKIVERVRDALVAVDPSNRVAYEAGAADYSSELDSLDVAYRQGVAQCDRRVFVTSHAAFGHLANRYGLAQDAIAGIDPEAEPDPARLADLASKVKAEGVTTIFTESLVSAKVAETLAREAGATTAVLDPLEGLSDDDQRRGETYVSVMRRNLERLRIALGCR